MPLSQCGLVLARRSREAIEAVIARKGGGPSGIFDVWFADDGQALCRPADVDCFLACLDDAVARSGCTRGEGRDVKSMVRLVGHPDALAAFHATEHSQDWITDRIRRTCRIESDNSAIEVLGSIVGAPCDRAAQFHDCVSKLEALHATLGELDDPQVELVLGRKCADISRVAHLLRTNGFFLPEDVATKHDAAQRRFLENSFAGELHEHAVQQASTGVRDGGLGFRRASQSKDIAFIASRIEARPFVEQLFVHMAASGVHIPGCMALFDSQLQQSIDQLLSTLDAGRADMVRSMCANAGNRATERFEAYMSGSDDRATGRPVGDGHAGAHLVTAHGMEDDEHPTQESSVRLQKQLAKVLDGQALERLSDSFEELRSWPDMCRIRELRDPNVSHEWLWSLSSSTGGKIRPHEFVTAVRARLGACHSDEAQVCGCCGSAILGPFCTHAFCCAPGERTRGHNDVRDALLDFARLGDSTAEPEVLGLIASAPDLRPADVLTTALGGDQSTALDVSVAAPDAIGAGDDCTESKRRKKLDRYARFASELGEHQIVYRPVVWSCFGREHADTSSVMIALAHRAARRRGLADFRPLLSAARASIGVALARRIARILF